MRLFLTPNALCDPAQRMHTNDASVTDAHCGSGAPQSQHVELPGTRRSSDWISSNMQQQLDKILSLNPPGVKGWFIVDGVVTLQGEISLSVVVWEPNKTAPVFSKESESVKSSDSDFPATIPLPLPKVGVYILSTPAQLVKSSCSFAGKNQSTSKETDLSSS